MGRNIGSRRPWTFRRSRLKAELPLDLIYGDLRIGADLPVSHPEWPRPDGQGAGNEKWEPALTRVYESELDLDALKVNLLVGDLDRMLHVYQETGVAIG